MICDGCEHLSIAWLGTWSGTTFSRLVDAVSM